MFALKRLVTAEEAIVLQKKKMKILESLSEPKSDH